MLNASGTNNIDKKNLCFAGKLNLIDIFTAKKKYKINLAKSKIKKKESAYEKSITLPNNN